MYSDVFKTFENKAIAKYCIVERILIMSHQPNRSENFYCFIFMSGKYPLRKKTIELIIVTIRI